MKRRPKSAAYALIVSLVLMAFILLLLVSLRTFIEVEIKVASVNHDNSVARKNALLALNVALGELQKYAGPDQRTTARAEFDVVEADGVVHNPYWTGVWRQDPASSFRDPELLTWLVSGNETAMDFVPTDDLADPVGAGSNTVWLVGDATVDSDAAKIKAPKVAIADSGHYAWWIGDEGIKAHVGLIDSLDTRPADERIYSFLSAQRSGGEQLVELGEYYPANDAGLGIAHSLSQLSFVGQDAASQTALRSASRSLFHDVTLSSNGLLTNSAKGGLKKDLSAWLNGTTSANAPGDTDYIFNPVGTDTYGVPQWGLIRSYADITGGGAVNPTIQTETQHGVFPVVTYSYLGVAASSKGNGAAFRVQLFPVVVLWNPYSVPIAATDFEFGIGAFSGVSDQINFYNIDTTGPDSDDTASATYQYLATLHLTSGVLDDDPNNHGDRQLFRFTVRAPEIAPGESLVFGLADSEHDSEYTPGQNILVANATSPSLNSVNITSSISVSYDLNKLNQLPIFYRWETNTLNASGGRYNVALRVKPEVDDNPLGFDFGDGTLQAIYDIGYGTPTNNIYTEWTTDAIAPAWRIRNISSMNYNGIIVQWLAQHNLSAPESSRSPRDSQFNTNHSGSMNYSDFSGEAITNAIQDAEGYWHMSTGDSIASTDGTITNVVLREFLPGGVPLFSIGQLSHVNLSSVDTYPTWPVGNSLASFRVALDATSDTERYYSSSPIDRVYDLSYLLNEALWDEYFFSTIPSSIIQDDIDAEVGLPNERLSLQKQAPLSDVSSAGLAFDRSAAYLNVNGAFNVNSTSAKAWAAVLAGMNGMDYNPATGDSGLILENPFSRYFVPSGTPNSPWGQTYRTLTPDQIDDLAEAIVEEVKARGPFLTMADFVNRRLEDSKYGFKGPLQAAIDAQSANAASGEKINESDSYGGSAGSGVNSTRYYLPQLKGGDSAYDYEPQTPWKSRRALAPGYLSQADILSALGSFLSARSDTFTIRAYGDAVNPLTGDVAAQAWCEAIVQRVPEYVDASIDPWQAPAAGSDAERFGRKFRVVSFRWLTVDEI